MHAVVSERSGKSASRVPVLFSSPEAKMVLIVLSETQLRICPTAGLAMLVYNIFSPPDMGVCGAYVLLQVSGKLNWQNWGEVGRKGKKTSAHSFLWPQGICSVCIGLVWASGQWAERKLEWSCKITSNLTASSSWYLFLLGSGVQSFSVYSEVPSTWLSGVFLLKS